MTDQETIICRPTKWFLWRALAMLAMFGVFFVLFIKDWKVGYPKKNVVYYTYKAFEEAEKQFEEREQAVQRPEDWEKFAREQKIPYPEETGILPAGIEIPAPWPAELQDYDGYKGAFEAERNRAVPPLWVSYSDKQGWESKAPEHGFDDGKIREQLYFGLGAGVLALLALFYLVRTQRRMMVADGEGFCPPGGKKIPYGKMHRIDKRKWETKGLAYIHYEGEGGGQKKAKVDGMVYGQFREEDGAPAERLFQQVLRNFSGELIELELPEDERDEADGAETAGEERED